MSHVRVRSADQPLHRLLLPASALALGAAFVVGTAGVSAQDEAAVAADGIDGSWTLDTSIAGFEDDLRSGSWVGFRVAEVLNPGGDVQAIGRTPLVSGRLDASGTVIENATIEADLTGILSDRSRREDAIQRALGTNEFPIATFVSTEPADLGAVPGEEPFAASVSGSLTIRDVSQDVTLELMGQRVGDTVVVVGTLPVDFTSFDVTMPTAPIVVSVEDSGDLEWQLFFTRDDEMADDEMTEEATADDEMADDEMAEEGSAES